jgi:hypothetical protein
MAQQALQVMQFPCMIVYAMQSVVQYVCYRCSCWWQHQAYVPLRACACRTFVDVRACVFAFTSALGTSCGYQEVDHGLWLTKFWATRSMVAGQVFCQCRAAACAQCTLLQTLWHSQPLLSAQGCTAVLAW